MNKNLALDAMLARAKRPLSLPDSFQGVDDAVRSPTADAQRIADAVGMDQAMASRVLKIANSPLYSFSTKVDTIARAVAVIGTRQVRDLALSSTILELCNGMMCPGIAASDFWTHSFAVGSLARTMAANRRDPNPERYFLAGMLTTIGRLILSQIEPEMITHCIAENKAGTLLHHCETKAFGFHQGEMSAALMDRWLLPQVLVHCVEGQYGPITGQSHLSDAALIHGCSVLITSAGIGNCGECMALPLDPSAWDLLHLDPQSLPDLMAEVSETATSLCSLIETTA